MTYSFLGEFNRKRHRVLRRISEFQEHYFSYTTNTKLSGIIYVATKKKLDRKEKILRQYYNHNDEKIEKLKKEIMERKKK